MQERHSPTQSLTPNRPALRNLTEVRRRVTDARLWDRMTGAQQDAAQEIAFAFESMSQGLGFTTVNWERLPGACGPNNAIEAREKLLGDYVGWARGCHAAHISHSMIIDVLVFGFSCRALDHDRRVRSGWSRRNLLAGLTLYCRMKGWNCA
ncbi:MAG: hypothetical protein PSY14_11290 [bacterium]|nr:hypothetical protein [bacterium]